MSKKLSLKFVNNKKPFEVKYWTVANQKNAFKRLTENSKDLSEEEKNIRFQQEVVYEKLKEFDENVKFEDIKNLHPDNLIELFELIYNAGKVDVYFRERKTKKKDT